MPDLGTEAKIAVREAPFDDGLFQVGVVHEGAFHTFAIFKRGGVEKRIAAAKAEAESAGQDSPSE